MFVLESKVGKDRFTKKIVETEIMANVVNPLLVCSVTDLNFTYVWTRDEESNQVQKREVRNFNFILFGFQFRSSFINISFLFFFFYILFLGVSNELLRYGSNFRHEDGDAFQS